MATVIAAQDAAGSDWPVSPLNPLYVGGSGYTTIIQVVPAVTAVAYAAGTCMGPIQTFANAARLAAGSGLIQAATATFNNGVVPSLDLILFSATPAGGTLTNAVAVAIATADLAKVIGVIHLTDATLLGAASPSIMSAETQVMPFKLASGTSLFGALVTRSAVSLASTTDVTISLSVLQD